MKSRRNKAFVLAAVFFVMVVIILMIASLFRLVPQEIRWSSDHRRETLAYYTATGGVKHALAWLRKVRLSSGPSESKEPFLRTGAGEPYEIISVGSPGNRPLSLRPNIDANPDGLDTFFPSGIPALHSKPGRIRLPGDWAAEVYIFPDKNTAPHPALNGGAGTLTPCYTLVSLAFRDSNGNGVCDTGIGGENYALRVETSLVERTFARYAYFVDQWSSVSPSFTRLSVFPSIPEQLFSGPVHSNDTPVIHIQDPGTFWSQATTAFPAPFGGEVSFSGDVVDPKAPDSFDGIAYFQGNFQGTAEGQRPYTGAGPFTSDEGRYGRLYKMGQQALRRTQRIELPNDWSRMARAAWGVESGREVAVDSAGADQVFINNEDLGIAVTGALQEFRLDLVDSQGNSVVFGAAGNVSNAPGVGQQVIKMVQENPVSFISGNTTVDITTTRIVPTTGPYSITRTLVSDVELPGYSPQLYDRTVSMTTTTIPRLVPSSTTVIPVPPSGPGPGGGGTITHTSYTTIDEEVEVPVTEPATQYLLTEIETGDGPYDITETDIIGNETVPVIETYHPLDAVVVAKDGPVSFPINYFYPTDLPDRADFPVFLGDTPGFNVTVPEGKTAIVRHDRINGKSFEVKILDGEPNGVVAVYGQVSQFKGVNRGSKTVAAIAPGGPRLEPTNLRPLQITDQVLQYNLPRGDIPSNGNHTLGLIGSNITMPGDSASLLRFPDASRAFYIYASLFAAQGQFAADALAASAPLGELRVVGGVIQRSIGELVVGSGGWASRYLYDRFQTLNSPPTFPPDGRFDVTFFRVTSP